MITDLAQQVAEAIAQAQNVPFVGAKQIRIAEAVIPLILEAESAALNLAASTITKTCPSDWVVKADSGENPVLTAWLDGLRAAHNVVMTMKQETDIQALADQGADR